MYTHHLNPFYPIWLAKMADEGEAGLCLWWGSLQPQITKKENTKTMGMEKSINTSSSWRQGIKTLVLLIRTVFSYLFGGFHQ